MNLRTLILVLSLVLHAGLCDAFDGDTIILSNGSSLKKGSIVHNQISILSRLPEPQKWSQVTWPSYNKQQNLIYVEAQNKDFGLNYFIFSISVEPFGENVTKIVDGAHPAISDNGRYLSYYKHPHQLRLIDLKSSTDRLLVSNFSNGQPAVWIGNHTLLYSDTENKMQKVNILTSVTENTGHDYVIPGALSPAGDRVLCGSYYGRSIYMYIIETNAIHEIKKSNIFSMGTSFVWMNNSQDFLYTRQTFLNFVKFYESRSLFLYLSKGKELKLIDRFALFGGVSLK